ncbi:putative protein orph-D8 [Microplitis demolitor]
MTSSPECVKIRTRNAAHIPDSTSEFTCPMIRSGTQLLFFSEAQYVSNSTYSKTPICIIHTKIKYVYLVPREWLAGPWELLECILFERISNYYRRFKRMSGVSIHYLGIIGLLQYDDKLIWIRKYDDQRRKPDLKEYLSFSVPCIYCAEMEFLKNIMLLNVYINRVLLSICFACISIVAMKNT